MLAALYILLMYQRTMTGPSRASPTARSATCRAARRSVVAPLIASILVLGFYPKPVLDVINPAVDDAEPRRRHRPGADAAASREGAAK